MIDYINLAFYIAVAFHIAIAFYIALAFYIAIACFSLSVLSVAVHRHLRQQNYYHQRKLRRFYHLVIYLV